MKVIVPVAGAGTRLRPFTYSNPKPLISVAGKPIIGHIVDRLAEAGLNDFVFITGYLADKTEQFIHERYNGNINYEFVRQVPRLGLAHAIYTTRTKLKYYDGPVIIILGDTIIDINYTEFIQEGHNTIAVQKVDTPERFGIVHLDEAGYITSIIEKPRIPKSNIAVAGLYKFESYQYLLSKCDEVQRKNIMNFGEYQLTDAIKLMLKDNIKIKSFFVNHWFDCGNTETLLQTNKILLSQMWDKDEMLVPEDIKINNIIIHPVFIPRNCNIRNSVIGPFVSLGEGVEIKNTLIENSIIGEGSIIREIMLRDSIIGTRTRISSNWHKINLGDNAELNLGF